MSMGTQLQLTADGSHTLFVPQLDEHYHSTNGAIQESKHIFINAGLRHCSKNKIHIFEVGFGTGLNAYLTLLDNLTPKREIHYTTIEAYPIDKELVSKLNFAATDEEKHYFQQLHNAQWEQEEEICEGFYLTKIKDDLTKFDFAPQSGLDLIYFDAFAPEKQAEMWAQAIFANIYESSNEGAILTTYCAKGVVRRTMQAVGFEVERLPGPIGKREILRAIKR